MLPVAHKPLHSLEVPLQLLLRRQRLCLFGAHTLALGLRVGNGRYNLRRLGPQIVGG